MNFTYHSLQKKDSRHVEYLRLPSLLTSRSSSQTNFYHEIYTKNDYFYFTRFFFTKNAFVVRFQNVKKCDAFVFKMWKNVMRSFSKCEKMWLITFHFSESSFLKGAFIFKMRSFSKCEKMWKVRIQQDKLECKVPDILIRSLWKSILEWVNVTKM